MKKSILRKLLEYCPDPAVPLIKLLKRYAVPTVVAISVSIVLASFFLLVQNALSQSTLLPLPPLITNNYNPGVSVGDYVVYGNFVCTREHSKGVTCIKDLAFRKIEVIAVSGKEVTFLHTQQFKNGTTTWMDGRTESFDVEKGDWSDNTENWIDYSIVIAANLTEGQQIHSTKCDFPGHQIIKTEVREYLGASRNVNILRNPVDLELNITDNLVYDQISGIRLESAFVNSDGDVVTSVSIVETNIFSAPAVSSEASFQEDDRTIIPPVATYVVIGSSFILIFLTVVVFFRKKKLRGGEKTVE